MAHDQIAVGDERLPPVAARRAYGQKVYVDDMRAEMREDALQPFHPLNAALTLRARSSFGKPGSNEDDEWHELPSARCKGIGRKWADYMPLHVVLIGETDGLVRL